MDFTRLLLSAHMIDSAVKCMNNFANFDFHIVHDICSGERVATAHTFARVHRGLGCFVY